MIKIGEMSKICNVSVQTLRYYDKIGLLKADKVEESSGYRYYSPEKVRTFQRIEYLKKTGLTLDEIKLYFNAPIKEQYRILEGKKQFLYDSIQKTRNKINKIDRLCEDSEMGLIPITEQIKKITFEDDPPVIGKWLYVGNMDPSGRFMGEEKLTKKDVYQKYLYFLPGGAQVWTYFWTNGTIYMILHAFNVIVPQRYQIFKHGDETYMRVDWIADKFVNTVSDDSVRVYLQIDTCVHTKSETYNFRDETDLPYRADPQVLGEWEAVDIISDPNEFTVNPKKWYNGKFWIVGLKFCENGICNKISTQGEHKYARGCKYTAGILIDEHAFWAQHYMIRSEGDTDYLIMEHKSGDYSYMGKVTCYYVFKRESGN